jgi:PKD repeat protein
MHIRKVIFLMATVLVLIAGLLLDQHNQAIASPSAVVSNAMDTKGSSDICSLQGITTNALSIEAAAMRASIPNGEKVDAAVLEKLLVEDTVEFYVILNEQADLSKAATLTGKDARTAYVFEQLTRTADKTQAPLLSYLAAQGVQHESMYIQNMIHVYAAGLTEVNWLATRADVARIEVPPDAKIDPVWRSMSPEQRISTVEWNIARVHAPEAWAMGINGEGYVVASNDTGVDYTHPALVGKYRGNLGGGNFDHNYNWWNGPGDPAPHDVDGHGTHTTGTMVGDDGGANQIGVAPGAKWIACGGLYATQTLICLQFFLAPWDLNQQNADPTKSPDSINNSWYDPSGYDYRTIIQNLNAAGIAVIKSAGNWGPDCDSISPPGNVPEIISTAAFAQGDIIADFSSRGPSSTYGETILKPEVAAPGVSVRSAYPGNDYVMMDGTSMAAPHTTALVTLMWQAAPCIAGDVPLTKQIMIETAEAKIDAQCAPFVDHPNDVWGWGILDDYAAVQAAMALCGGQGALQGSVLDLNGLAPLEGADITAVRDDGYTRHTTTDVTGYYTTTASHGYYTVTASIFGYMPGIANVTIITDMVTTQDFVLELLPEYTISGVVVEAGSGTPLLAEISILNTTEITPVMTDPGTGVYALTVPAGSYTMHVAAAFHMSEERDVVVDGDIVEDFALQTLPCILLVDDDQNSPDVQADYTTALDQAGLAYNVWDTSTDGDPTEADLAGYGMVIWFTGYAYSNTFNAANEAAVGAYLEAGGRFLLSSQEYLYDYGLTPFGSNYLHIDSFASDVSQTTVTGDNPFAGLGPYTLSYDFTNYSDRVNPDAQAVLAFTGNQGNAAVAFDGTTFKTVFLGFPFEAIDAVADRAAVLQAAADFFGGCAACDPVSGTSFTYDPLEPVAGDVATFTGTASGTEPISYEWDFGDGEFASGAVVTHTFSVGGDYTVLLETSNVCGEDSFSVLVTVLDLPNISVEPQTITQTLTMGESGAADLLLGNRGDLTLTFVISESPGVDWLAVDPTAGEILAGEILTATLSFDSGTLVAGEYNAALQVTSNDPEEPWISVPVTLIVLDLPVEELAASNDSPTMLGEVTTLSATVTGGTNVVFAWDFGDGEFGSGQVVTHTYAAAGVYTATVTASNPVSELSASTLVTVVAEPTVYQVILPLVLKESTPAAAPEPSGMWVVRDARIAQ